MTKMLDHVDDMRTRLTDVSNHEQTLLRALSDALTRVDQALLEDVRDIARAHEVRRGLILSELHDLASRIGAFPTSHAPHEALTEDDAALPRYAPQPHPGDWREAINNIDAG
jgi:hypothetical protein